MSFSSTIDLVLTVAEHHTYSDNVAHRGNLPIDVRKVVTSTPWLGLALLDSYCYKKTRKSSSPEGGLFLRVLETLCDEVLRDIRTQALAYSVSLSKLDDLGDALEHFVNRSVGESVYQAEAAKADLNQLSDMLLATHPCQEKIKILLGLLARLDSDTLRWFVAAMSAEKIPMPPHTFCVLSRGLGASGGASSSRTYHADLIKNGSDIMQTTRRMC